MKASFTSRVMLVSMVGAVGCASAPLDEPTPASASQEDSIVEAWVPGTQMPSLTHKKAVGRILAIDWERERSVDELTDHSALIVGGRVESTRYDVVRTYADSKNGGPSGPESGIYSDLPITIATVRVDETVRALKGLETPSGGAVSAGTTVDVVFPGGLLADGSTLEPDDNPLPVVGEQTVLFLEANQGVKPLATRSTTGTFFVTGGPDGRVLLQDGVVKAAASKAPAGEFVGKPAANLLGAVAARASTVAYVSRESRPAPEVASAPEGELNAQYGWCGIGSLYGWKWCRKPTTVTYTDYSDWRWPLGDALNAWTYASISNSLYLQWRGSGASDVYVYSNWYGYTGWHAMTDQAYTYGSCLTSIRIRFNNTYYTGAPHATKVSRHEVGHTLGFADHYSSTATIMWWNPAGLASSALSSCDQQAAAQLYPY